MLLWHAHVMAERGYSIAKTLLAAPRPGATNAGATNGRPRIASTGAPRPGLARAVLTAERARVTPCAFRLYNSFSLTIRVTCPDGG